MKLRYALETANIKRFATSPLHPCRRILAWPGHLESVSQFRAAADRGHDSIAMEMMVLIGQTLWTAFLVAAKKLGPIDGCNRITIKRSIDKDLVLDCFSKSGNVSFDSSAVSTFVIL